MPTYNYRCNGADCSQQSIPKEYIHKMSDPKPLCDDCKKEMEKIHTGMALVKFKGKWFNNGGY